MLVWLSHVRAYVCLLKAIVNWINLPDCARTRKYSVAFSDRPFNSAGIPIPLNRVVPRARSSIPIPYSGLEEFWSYEDVLKTGWHSWRFLSSDGNSTDGSPHPSVWYTTELRASAFWIEQQLHHSFELTCQHPPSALWIACSDGCIPWRLRLVQISGTFMGRNQRRTRKHVHSTQKTAHLTYCCNASCLCSVI